MENKYWEVVRLADIEKILQQILESQLFMQNQMNKMQEQIGTMQGQINTIDEKIGTMDKKIGTMDKKIGTMDEKIDNNHKEVIERLDNVEKRLTKLENNQDAIRRFMLESDSSFRKSEEAYRVIQDLKNVFAKED